MGDFEGGVLHQVTQRSYMSDEQTTISEFGKGLTYCLGLFLCHAERFQEKKVKEILGDKEDLWFNASSDHFYELQIPDNLPADLSNRLAVLRDKCLTWGHGYTEPKATKEDRIWAVKEAKELLRMIDEHFGIATIKATWD